MSDPVGRAQHELDVVATVRRPSGATRVAAIGEAKHTARHRTLADLVRLDAIRELLVARDLAPSSAKLLLFSAMGFDRNLTNAAADRPDVELIGLDRMYAGE